MRFIHLNKIILSSLLLLFSCTLYAKETLVFALDLIRHGDRTPLMEIPKASYHWPEGMGQLTPLGMRQEFQLGTEFRKRYIDQSHLLPNHFQPETIYVFSTNFDRTLMSAEAALLGLYPLSTGPHLAGTQQPALPSAYQPIPIHTKLVEAGDSFVSDADPANYRQQLKQYVTSKPEWIQKKAALQPKFFRWSKATGLTVAQINDQLNLLADTLMIYQIHHVPLPSELTQADVKEITAAGLWDFTTKFQSKEIASIIGPRLLATISGYIENASQQKTPLKYVLLSAHDTTLMSVMTTLGAPLSTPPHYASDLNFSLYKIADHDYRVSVKYNDKAVVLSGCSPTSCTLAQFMQLVRH